MSESQLTMFDVERGAVSQHGYDIPAPHTLAAAADPSTSREAAEELVASGSHRQQRDLVYRLVCHHRGMTSSELAKINGGGPATRYMFARRLPDLMHETPPRVRQGDKRVCGVSGRQAVTWWPVVY